MYMVLNVVDNKKAVCLNCLFIEEIIIEYRGLA